MQGLESQEVMRRALRARVCPICRFRPTGTENLAPTIARDCEGRCAIFENVPALAEIARKLAGDPLGSFEHAIEDGICQSCRISNSAGDYCADRLARDCPLSCYASLVLTTLEPIVVKQCACKT